MLVERTIGPEWELVTPLTDEETNELREINNELNAIKTVLNLVMDRQTKVNERENAWWRKMGEKYNLKDIPLLAADPNGKNAIFRMK